MELYKSKYLVIKYIVEKEIFEYIWKATSEKMSDEDYISEAKKILEFGLKTDARYVIADNRDFRFIILPEIQEMVANQILSGIKGIVHKFAHVVSKDFITQLSLEQLYDEDKVKQYHSKYFDNYEDALKWVEEK